MEAYNSLLPWQWAMIGIAIALVIFLGIIICYFCCRKRPGTQSIESAVHQPETEVPSPLIHEQITLSEHHKVPPRNAEYSTELSAPPPRIQSRHINSEHNPTSPEKPGRICSLSLTTEAALTTYIIPPRTPGSTSSADPSAYSIDISLGQTITPNQTPGPSTRHNSPFHNSMRGPTPPWTKS
ncbi:hypothetical protein CLU79DRAFT_832088 [Phycomyces nitens]|nr:hypothetical protein CLU79DRAFT_832088 [Phycomyces nitens]